MRALSVRQPWASLIAAGTKTIEVRSWRTHYRGPLLICAAASRSKPFLLNVAPPVDAPLGVALCVVDVVDCRPIADGDAIAACFDSPTGYAWVLRLVDIVRRTPIKGRLGFFDVDHSLVG